MVNLIKKVTTQVDSLKGALPRQSWKTEGYSTGPSAHLFAFSLQPIYLSRY